jgi:iron(III) transport system substrate-binding protein
VTPSTTRPTRRGVLTGAVLAATLLVAGCGGAPADPAPVAGDGPRTLTLYSGREEDLVGPLLAQFEQQSGITVDTRYGSTTELAAQLAEEGGATPAQVFLSQDAGALGALAGAGAFAPLPEEVRGAVTAPYTATDGTWTGLTGRVRVAAYNTRVPEAEVPADVTELTDPRWRGRVGIAPTNASFQAFVTALRVQEGDAAARAFLEGLRANEVQVFPRNTAILEAVDSGVVDVGLINHYYVAAAETPPANTALKFGAPGTASALVNVTGAGILAGAAESTEARELLRFLVSPQAQEYFARETGEYPLVAGVAGPAGMPALADLRAPRLDLADLEDLDGTTQLMTQVGLL